MEKLQTMARPCDSEVPDANGRYGPYGGRYVPETLMAAVEQLTAAYAEARQDAAFWHTFDGLLKTYAGRPSALTFAERLTERLGGAKIYLKREDLNHTGAHKINNTIGQVLLTKRMNKPRVIAETGAGQHGVATATAAARFGLKCRVYMGAEDIRRQKLNVFRMELLGTEVVSVETGQKTLKDAINEAMRDWMASCDDTHYVIGSVMGPHPFPLMVRDFQSVIGHELRVQMQDAEGRLPDVIIGCVGGGSSSAGAFAPFIADSSVRLIGVEAGGKGVGHGLHAATLCAGRRGVLHGMETIVLQDDDGQTMPVHSISAGLDYPGVGPEHAYWHDIGRVEYTNATDTEALDAFMLLCETEGIIPALESSHAVAHAVKLAPTLAPDQTIVINLSGRGDKDVVEVARVLGRSLH